MKFERILLKIIFAIYFLNTFQSRWPHIIFYSDRFFLPPWLVTKSGFWSIVQLLQSFLQTAIIFTFLNKIAVSYEQSIFGYFWKKLLSWLNVISSLFDGQVLTKKFILILISNSIETPYTLKSQRQNLCLETLKICPVKDTCIAILKRYNFIFSFV